MRRLRFATLTGALAALVVACTAAQLDIPPLTPDEGGAHLPGKVVWHDLLTDTPQQTRDFYGELFGWEFRPLPGGVNYELIYFRGEPIGGMVDQTRLPTQADISQWVVVLGVADVDAAVDQVRTGGGTVFTEPTSLGARGRIAVVADPQGALLALLQTDGRDPVDRQAPPASGVFLWNELWTGDPASAASFYMALAPYSQDVRELQAGEQTMDYHVLESSGKPRVGIRGKPMQELPSRWVSYLRVGDETALKQIVSRVEELGGGVLASATPRPAGGSVAVIAGPSGAGIALQTWPVQSVQANEEGSQ